MATEASGSGFDPYQTLGVSRLATNDEIHRAYRGLAKRFHPDTDPGDAEAAERFAQVSHAYEVLTDDTRRRAYDLATAATHGPRAARMAPAPTGNTAVRGPGANPSHRPRESAAPDPEPTDWPAVLVQLGKWALIVAASLFVGIAIVAYTTGQG
jgi:curved DNA-binding protein CbpA